MSDVARKVNCYGCRGWSGRQTGDTAGWLTGEIELAEQPVKEN